MHNVFYAFRFQKNDALFERLWRMKISVRESLQNWLLSTGMSCESAQMSANACSEMLENCIKYASAASPIHVAICVEESSLTIETSNKAETLHEQELQQSISTLNETSDPSQLFARTLCNLGGGDGRLGLIKIIVETKGRLELLPAQHSDIARIRLSINLNRKGRL